MKKQYEKEENEKKELQIKSERAITLIALTITIIILLILASVTITAIVGDNGILQNAIKAKEETEKANEKEQIALAIMGAIADSQTGELTEDGLKTNLIDKQKNNATITTEDENFRIRFNDSEIEYLVNKETGTIKEADRIGESGDGEDGGEEEEKPPIAEIIRGVPVEGNTEYNGAIIPDGFALSEVETEQDVNKGLVVIAPDKSEFVWIPVDDINNMVMCKNKQENDQCNIVLNEDKTALICTATTHESGEICGKLYAESIDETINEQLTTQTYEHNKGIREPDFLEGMDTEEDYNNGLFDENTLQNDFEEMALSVAKYGGFYIGRYETSMNDATETSASESGTSTIVQSKKGVMPVSAEYNRQRWYGFYDKQKNYAADIVINNTVKSSMVWGSQYDSMLIWALKEDDKDKVNKESIEHGPDPTGSEPSDVINNIFDLGNNFYECTLEGLETESRVRRGENYGIDNPPSYRDDSEPSYRTEYYTSRITLYII